MALQDFIKALDEMYCPGFFYARTKLTPSMAADRGRQIDDDMQSMFET